MGLTGVKQTKFNRQPSKRLFFYRQPSKMLIKINLKKDSRYFKSHYFT